MSWLRQPQFRSYQVAGLHVLLLACLVSAFYCFGVINYLPAENTLRNWDVIWYEQIKNGGYAYAPTGVSNVAFFPLFPYLWRWSGLSLLGISLANAGLFLVMAAWLARQLQLPARLQLLLLSTPTLLFMIVPYSEALFFSWAALLVVGLRQRKLSWWLLGLLGCGLTRSASTLFTPALLLTVMLWAQQPGQRRVAWRWGLLGLLTLVATTGFVALLQWQQVGNPWAFAEVQRRWDHYFRLPSLPLTDYSGIDMLWLNGLALGLGLAAAGLAAWLLRQALRRQAPTLPLEVVFSLGYFASGGLFILFFQGGSIWNASRYLFTTPFLMVLAGYLATQPAWPWRRYALLGGLVLVYCSAFGLFTNFSSFTLGQALWYFGVLTAYLLLYLAWRQLRWQGEATMLLYTTNIVLLLHLLNNLMQGYKVQ